MKKAALYIRVSTQEQALHGLSLDAQQAALEAWAKKEKVKVIGVYADEGISARKKASKRPALQRLLADVKAGKIDLIVFTKLDRWFRNISEYYKVQEILEAHQVDWRTIQEDYDTATASGRLKVNIMLSVAQDEADRTSERIKAIINASKEKGESIAGRLPKGYKRENRRIVFDEATAPVVRQAFEMYMRYGSASKVIRSFPDLHLDYISLYKMIRNSAYIGDFYGVPVPPMLTMEEYNHIKSIRKSQTRKTKQNRIYIFSGLLFCGVCGFRFSGKARQNKYSEYIYYACGGNSRFVCENCKTITEKTVEGDLLSRIDGVICGEITLSEKEEKTSHKQEREKIRRKLSKLAELYVNEMISIEDYKRQYSDLQAALDAIPEDTPTRNMAELKQTFQSGWKDMYNKLSAEGKQAFWRKFIDKIIIEDGKVKNIFLR